MPFLNKCNTLRSHAPFNISLFILQFWNLSHSIVLTTENLFQCHLLHKCEPILSINAMYIALILYIASNLKMVMQYHLIYKMYDILVSKVLIDRLWTLRRIKIQEQVFCKDCKLMKSTKIVQNPDSYSRQVWVNGATRYRHQKAL